MLCVLHANVYGGCMKDSLLARGGRRSALHCVPADEDGSGTHILEWDCMAGAGGGPDRGS